MAVVKTYDTRLNKDYDLTSAQARGLQFITGSLAVTYSAAGGLTWTLPFAKVVYVHIPAESGYVFSYNKTTTMLRAWMVNSTTGPLTEVASDTDFTTLTDSLSFVAFGF